MDIPNKKDIPYALQDRDQWIIWKEEKRNGKITKIPVAPWSTGHWGPSDATNPSNLTSLDEAIEHAKKREGHGLGFSFLEEGELIGIDLDDCIDEEGNVRKVANEIITNTTTYTEISPSGKGIHVIGKGEIPKAYKSPIKREDVGVEVYEENRFFTFTGRIRKGRKKIRNVQGLVEEIAEKYAELKDETFNSTPVETEFPVNCVELIEEYYPDTKIKNHGSQKACTHPVHGSSTGRNLVIDGTLWHCHRHNCGGGPAQLAAVFEGIVECGKWSQGENPIKGEEFVEVLERLKERGVISEADIKDLLNGEKEEVRRTISLEDGEVDIALDGLKKRNEETRANFHYYKGETHRFEENRKLSSQNMRQFCNYVGKLEELSETDRDKIFKAISDMKDKARKKASREETEGIEGSPEEEDLSHIPSEDVEKYLLDKPLVKIVEWTNEVHIGDEGQKILARLSAYSRALIGFPINLWPLGRSGSGKTDLLETMVRTIPEEYVIKINSASPKSMYYYCKDKGADILKNKILFFNEVDADEKAQVLLRSLSDPAEDENRLMSVEDQETLDIKIEGLPVCWFTSVDPLNDEQLKNRFLFCNPNEQPGHKEDIAEFQKENIQKGILHPVRRKSFPIAKKAFRKVIEDTKDWEVRIPFDWEWNYPQDARLQKFFGALMHVSAKIHHLDRPKIEEENIILATLDDYYIAKILFETVLEQTMAGLKEKDMDIYELVPADKNYAKKRSDISEAGSIATSTARHALERLVEAGLINKEKSGKAWTYWKSEFKPALFVSELVQDSLTEESLKEKIESFTETCTNNCYIAQGVTDFSHTFPYIGNIVQLLDFTKSEAKGLFEDAPSCTKDITSYAGFDELREEEEESYDKGTEEEEEGENIGIVENLGMTQEELVKKVAGIYRSLKRENGGELPTPHDVKKEANEQFGDRTEGNEIEAAVEELRKTGNNDIVFQPDIGDTQSM